MVRIEMRHMKSFTHEPLWIVTHTAWALCMEIAVLVSLWEHKYGRRKATETFVFEFSYKCLNLSLEELIKRFILRQGMFRWQNLKKSATFFNPHNNFPGAKCRVIQKPEIRNWSVLIAKRTTLSNRTYVSIKVFSCCNTLWKWKRRSSEESIIP